METTIRCARRRALEISATCPACNAPMVGTSAIRAPAVRQCSTVRRKLLIVRNTETGFAMLEISKIRSRHSMTSAGAGPTNA